MSRVMAAGAIAAAAWPVWGWYLSRLGDRSDEPWCLVALLTAVVVIGCGRSVGTSLDAAGWRACATTLLYAASVVFLPPVFRCAAAFVAVGLTLASRGPVWGLTGLLVLSAPLASSLDFYLGYPLRSIVALLAAASLDLAGVAVRAEGTLLAAGERIVEVDAPCSGVRMLWTGLYLTFTLAALHRLDFRRTAAAVLTAAGLVVAGNVLRASALFFLETGAWRAPEAMHAAVGLVVFALAGMSIFALHTRLREGAT